MSFCSYSLELIDKMAHTKSAGTTKNGRESASKRLGVKIFGGQLAKIGSIIIRQRGSQYVPGSGVKIGKDDTIYAIQTGHVLFRTKRVKKYNGFRKTTSVVNVV